MYHKEAPESATLQTIAIGLGITTRKMTISHEHPTEMQIKNMPFFEHLLPSFCRTYDADFSYHFYIAYDYNDPLLEKQSNVPLFVKYYKQIFTKECETRPVANLTLIKVGYTRKPAWAQNDAMMTAYLDDNDFYYRVNDDTILESSNWQKTFISVLSKYDPPYIGVVGPSFEFGNKEILTYDFTHRTHVDIYGFYYPRVFEGFHADGWISNLYKPGRSIKHKDIWIKHVESLGQRYPSHSLPDFSVQGVIKDHQEFLNR